MRAKLIALLLALLAACGALAETLVVYPLSSQDTLLGVAVADRIAEALAGPEATDGVEVFGPDVAPSLVPPLVADDGFINPVAFLGAEEIGGYTGAALVRDALGADVVLAGSIALTGDDLEMTLYVSDLRGVRRVLVTAPEDDPGRLAGAGAAAAARALGVPIPATAGLAIDLSGPYGTYVRAVTLVGAGFLQSAVSLLDEAIDGGEADPRLESLLAELRRVLDGEPGADPALAAAMALGSEDFDAGRASEYFAAFEGVTDLPAASAWVGALAASVNDRAGANAAYDRAAGAYLYGRAARAAYRRSNDLPGLEDDLDALRRAVREERAGPAALIGLASTAQLADDLALEKTALRALGRAAPFFTYPWERLSFIAFDEDDAYAAAEALAVAVDLEPDSDLYWTNLGWAYYLLGRLDKSEEASLQAIDLEPSQFIAYFNLGLARAVTGRLEDALTAYQRALGLDPEVDDEAIHDLENALALYPDQPSVHYALATLYEAEGRRAEAADQFERFAQAAPEAAFADNARARVEALRAPLPPIEITEPVALTLGPAGSSAGPFHPGDAVFPSFEVYTPGDALPRTLDVTLRVEGEGGAEIASRTESVEVPREAIGFVIDRLGLTLPADLGGGDYTLVLDVVGDGERSASARLSFAVEGGPELLRQLLGRNIVMQAFESNRPLYDTGDLDRPDVLVDLLVAELRGTAELAEEALPEVIEGRFEGRTGGEVFEGSTADDVRDFLAFLLSGETRDATFVFVDAYAQWVVQGAPAE